MLFSDERKNFNENKIKSSLITSPIEGRKDIQKNNTFAKLGLLTLQKQLQVLKLRE